MASMDVAVSGDFVRRFSEEALPRGLPREFYAARMVIAFDASADEQERARVRRAVCGEDFPILSGLQFVFGRGLNADRMLSKANHSEIRHKQIDSGTLPQGGASMASAVAVMR